MSRKDPGASGNTCVISLTDPIVADEAILAESAIVAAVKTKESSYVGEVCCNDVKNVIMNQFSVEDTEVSVIKTYGADFLIKVSPSVRDNILKKRVISSNDFSLAIKPWKRELFSYEVEQNLKVVIDVKGLPEHVSTTGTVEEVLRPYCNVESISHPISYWPSYRVEPWTSCVTAIPCVHYLDVPEPIFGSKLSVGQQEVGCCRKMRRFPIELETRLYESTPDGQRLNDVDTDYDYDSDREPKNW